MRSQRQLIFAVAVILLGVVLLIANILDISLGMVCWPSILIALGILLLLRPQLIGSDSRSSQRLLGDIRRSGAWAVEDSEFWLGIGDVTLDLTDAEIPVGETTLRVWGFVTDVRVTAPEDVGVAVSSQAFIADANFLGLKRDSILAPIRLFSDNFEIAERRIAVETRFFLGEIRVQRA